MMEDPTVLEEDEPECRVCRGSSEPPDHVLYRACKCSGSIGWVHQDCLQSWLQVMVDNGRASRSNQCEVCHYTFRFEPLYAEHTPEHLSVGLVVLGVTRRLVQGWLPTALRVLACLAVWLGVMPLLTAHLYLSWVHKPSVLVQRLNWDCLALDWVGGLVVAALIIISFLSLMNFADFVRLELQPPGQARRRVLREVQRFREEWPLEHAGRPRQPLEEHIDNALWEQAQQEILGDRTRHTHVAGLARNAKEPGALARLTGHELRRGEQDHDDDDDDDDDDDSYSHREEEDDDDEDEDDHHSSENMDEEADSDADDVADRLERVEELVDALRHLPHRDEWDDPGRNDHDENFRMRLDVEFENDLPALPPPPPPPPALDDGAELDINIALDELLGLRGPLGVVIRNMLWLLAFNAIYLGVFVFTPRMVGLALSSIVLNNSSLAAGLGRATTPNTSVWNETLSNATAILPKNSTTSMLFNISSPMDVIWAIETQSAMLKTTFRLSDVLGVLLGYATCAAAVLFANFLWMASERFEWMHTRRHGRGGIAGENNDANMDDVRDALDELNRMIDGDDGGDEAIRNDQRGMAFVYALGVVLKAMSAVVKVGVLLMLKMFFLPVALGLCLDAATLTLLNGSLEERIRFAIIDLFSFTLLHWVAGITFMLLVTVSVLQLREVMHPNILAQVVRPQEPQPDLLGNLLHERVSTHMRRMAMSLVVYAFLLSLHVYIPIRLIIWAGFQPKLKFRFVILPHLQIPLELLFFHLCMLGLLEKNKNIIGQMQHHWLKLIGGLLGMIDSMLPRRVNHFRFIGKRDVHIDATQLDPFWQDLAKSKGKQQVFLLASNAHTFSSDSDAAKEVDGETKADGTRVLQSNCDYIRLPVRVPGRALRCRSMLLPTQISRYRLIRGKDASGQHIELWEEVPGNVIPRPPDGWDDLGQGGAFEQGRWGWGREKKSDIENGVACRQDFFRNQSNMVVAIIKIAILAIASWAVTSAVMSALVLCPLAAGRFILWVARIPDRWIHDPFAFGLGCVFVLPLFHFVFLALTNNEHSISQRFVTWLLNMRLPPTRKLMVLSTSFVILLGLVPFFLGSIVDLAIFKSAAWFMAHEPWFEPQEAWMDYLLGAVVLLVWLQYCRVGHLARQLWRFFAAAPNAGGNRDAGNAFGQQPVEAWAGENGRISRLLSVWKVSIVDYDYDKVDSATLLDDVCFPLLRALSIILFWPLLCLGVICWRATTLSGFLRVLVVRGALLLALAHQSSHVWMGSVRKMVEWCRKTARDDLFLMGEVLMSYTE